jgi:hypothetical protein
MRNAFDNVQFSHFFKIIYHIPIDLKSLNRSSRTFTFLRTYSSCHHRRHPFCKSTISFGKSNRTWECNCILLVLIWERKEAEKLFVAMHNYKPLNVSCATTWRRWKYVVKESRSCSCFPAKKFPLKEITTKLNDAIFLRNT